VQAAGEEPPEGQLEAMNSVSSMIQAMEDLVQKKRIEVVRDRDYLDALRAYMIAREGGSDAEEGASVELGYLRV
jgi:hypothetical protein